MFAKISFLLCATVVLSSKLKTTPKQLHTFVEQIDASLKVNQHEAQIEIRDSYASLNSTTNNAKDFVIGNLTEAAKPYWDEIATLKEEAADNGQDISACIDLGNEQLYALNVSTVFTPMEQIRSIYNEGYNIIINSSDSAYAVVVEFMAFKAVANNCSDNTCASELGLEAAIMYKNFTNIIEDAVNTVYEYSVTNLPGMLAGINIDSDAYVKNYTPYLEDVKNCVNK